MKPKVLLFFPNTSNDGVLPLAISVLSSIAKQHGFDVKYFETSFYKKHRSAGEDHEYSGEFKPVKRESIFELLPYERLRKDFLETLVNYKPDILAVSANSLEYDLFCELIEGIQSIKFKPFVIVGGIEATIAPNDVIVNQYVDALCVGEGEKAWEEFLLKFKAGQDITSVNNLWVKNGSVVHRNPLHPLLTEQELWAHPLDLSFFDKRHLTYIFDGEVYLRGNVELSRGCPYSCTYCVNAGLKRIYKGLGKFVRVRPPDNLQKEVSRLVEFGCEMLYFQDESFLSVPYHILKEFCHWYGNEVKLPILFMARPESVTDAKIKLVADMGVPVQISLGVESGSDRILRDICNRHTTLNDIKNGVKIIKKYNIRSTAYTMTGFPTETREEAFETINLIRSLKLDNSIMSIFFPFKGAPLREYCIKKGYISGDEKARTFTDPSILKNQPMSQDEITNLRRTYSLYTKLPEEYFPQIELCERNYEHHKTLYNELVSIIQQDYYNSWKLK